MSVPEVQIKQGKLRGEQHKTSDGTDYYSFLGIPYAQPPVGDLRFKAPLPAANWEGVRDATKNGDKCLQYDAMKQNSSTIIGSEDCLFINVYTTNLEADAKPLPVMVCIHGGGFLIGSGDADLGSPDFLLEQNLVYVSLNYRLNIFGFLNLHLPEAQGNMGLKDQVLALKWVQENIAAFNGDPSNVTIIGMSAGAASVEMLYLSPMAEGLFQKAIAESGSALNHWAHNNDIKELASSIAKSRGHEFDNTTELLQYLKEIPAHELIALAQEAIDGQKNVSGVLYMGFVPSIETEFSEQTSFKTKPALEVLRRGNFKKIPYLLGFCRHEGLITYSPQADIMTRMKKDKDFVGRLPYIFDKINFKALNDKLKKLYVKKSGDKEDAYIDFFTDIDFLAGIYVAGKLIASHGNTSVYFYEFAHDGDVDLIKAFISPKRPGVMHCAEVQYLFKMAGTSDFSERDALVRSRLLSMWTNFAKFGNPTPQINDVIPTKWEPVPKDGFKYLIIDEHLTMATELASDRMAFHEEHILKSYYKLVGLV